MKCFLKNYQNRQKSTKIIIEVISIVFYFVMFFLALGARRMHRISLPQVEITTPVIKSFGEGEVLSVACALPEKLVNEKKIFVVSEEMVNGEPRMIAREIIGLEIGRVSNGYREIVSGLDILSQVIVLDGELLDGEEVWIKGEWLDEEN